MKLDPLCQDPNDLQALGIKSANFADQYDIFSFKWD